MAGCPTDPLVTPMDARAESAVRDATPQDQQVIPMDTPEPMDAAAEDVIVPVDAVVDAVSPRDVVDAGRDVTTSCPCPTLPAMCTPPTVEEPVFTPRSADLQNQLYAVIACADRTLDMALYEVTSACFVDAMIAKLASDSDLQVRIVVENERCPLMAGVRQCELGRLQSNPRVSIVDDGRSNLMHHKFVIADGTRLWLGSANLSRNSFCTDENNALVLEDTTVIAAYATEFRRMFETRMFGPIAFEPAPSPAARFSVHFSPRSPSTQPPRWHSELINSINAARADVEFAISAFTRTDISDAFIAAHMRGVRVRGIVDSSYAMDPAVRALVTAGIAVRSGNMHSKELIVDGTTIVTGSANWSTNAWTNNENSLWIRDSNVAVLYRTQFERSFAAATVIR